MTKPVVSFSFCFALILSAFFLAMPKLPKDHPLNYGNSLALSLRNKSSHALGTLDAVVDEVSIAKHKSLFVSDDRYHTWADPDEIEDALDADETVQRCIQAVIDKPTPKTMQAAERAVLNVCNTVVLAAIAERFETHAPTLARYLVCRDIEYPNGRANRRRIANTVVGIQRSKR